MSYSNLRILCGLILSLPIAVSISLLAWGLTSSTDFAYIFNFGIFMALAILVLTLVNTNLKLAQAEKQDYTQKKFDIILSTLKYLDGNKPVYDNENEEIDFDKIEFDYFPTKKPDNFDQGSIQL